MRAACCVLMTMLAALLLGQAASAQAPIPGRNAIRAQLVAETPPAPGQSLVLALVMTPDEGWHGYWKNPGDSGIETSIAWRLPPGFKGGEIRYPVPGRLIIAGLMNYVYEGEYVQFVAIGVPANARPGMPLPIRGKLDYLACTDEICVPESAELALDLTIAAPTARSAAATTAALNPLAARFEAWRDKLPQGIERSGSFAVEGDRIRFAIPLPADFAVDADTYFFPLTDGAIDYSAAQAIGRAGDRLIVETDAGTGAGGLRRIEGVLRYGPDRGLSIGFAPGAAPAATGAGPAAGLGASVGEPATTLLALGGALLGGLLLNIMPCVFPILSLKALSLAKANGGETAAGETAARREALAYAGGAILACVALGGALLALRAGGASVGWAFQLQDPRVILLLLLLVTAIALNLAGLFELPALAGGGKLARSGGGGGAFWTGALAAFVATPCTGPFMGAAMGAALVLPTAAALAVFAGLGLGLALPFLLLGFVPALRRRLPKPGPWMARLRRILSAPMFLTALALAWILGRQAGVDGMAFGLGAALALALALWWVGRRQGGERAWLPLAPVALASLAALAVIPTATVPAAAGPSGVLAAEPFSEMRLAALQAEGRPVFVYFTADWCVTCKVNEKGAFESKAVADAFAARNVAVLVGDWTRGDAAIGRFLEKHGRSGVPLYLYYAPGKPAEVLPQLLTPGRLASLS